jgi:hypothetical protein
MSTELISQIANLTREVAEIKKMLTTYLGAGQVDDDTAELEAELDLVEARGGDIVQAVKNIAKRKRDAQKKNKASSTH